ncbi:MAG: type II toxin-antitoxin system RelE/ParE family toxin [Betaproteobacteria bacterium]|nr:type II toxin-antitoxin system RelE/ParE family toxin [Betaproteobacteria bacterium]MDH5288164.1 type II toxin-antitoxin system RelE/ParE family toxin [Betaproteobacteria bacterium]
MIYSAHGWVVAFHSSRVESQVLGLPAGQLSRFIRYAERMEKFGPDLGMPHTRAMGEGLFELRIKAAEGIVRVFYCTVVSHRIVFVHLFAKKTDKTPARELEIARRRIKELRRD